MKRMKDMKGIRFRGLQNSHPAGEEDGFCFMFFMVKLIFFASSREKTIFGSLLELMHIQFYAGQ